MNLRCLFLLPAVCLATFAAEDVVELDAIRASVSNIYFHCNYVAGTDKIAEMRVIWVAPGSGAEKAGLRVGDQLIAINGAPVAGKKRSEVITKSGGVAVRGTEVKFDGRRGFFRKNWSLTAKIDVHGNLEPEVEKKEPTER